MGSVVSVEDILSKILFIRDHARAAPTFSWHSQSWLCGFVACQYTAGPRYVLQKAHSQEWLCYLACQQIAGDDHALDFAGAFVNRDYAGVAIHALDVRFARIPQAAVNLHGFVRDAIHHFSRV